MAAAVLLAAAPALAQEGGPAPRCAILGQMAVFTWAETLQAVGLSSRDAVDTEVERLDRIGAIYDRAGCPGEALSGAFDCVIDRPEEETGEARLLACMRENGLSPAG